MTDNEPDLIRRAQADDANAFCSLAERYARRIYLLAFHYCRNAQDAEDLSQEVWLKAYQALAGFRSDSSFYTWLRRITINAFLNHQRAGSFRHQGQTTIVELLSIYKRLRTFEAAIQGEALPEIDRKFMEREETDAVQPVI